MRCKATIVTGTALLSVACGVIGTAGPELDTRELPPQVVTLRIGESRQVGPVDVFFARVPEDSRCPVDVVCVWEGNAVVELHMSVGKRPSEPIRLNSNLEPRVVEWNGLQLRLIDLVPHPRSNAPPDPEGFTAELRIVGVEAR